MRSEEMGATGDEGLPRPAGGRDAAVGAQVERAAMRVEEADVAIVGAGPAGLAAAATLAGFSLRVVVLDEGPAPGGRVPAQGAAPAGPSGAEVARRLQSEAEDAGARIRCGLSAWGIFPSWRVLTSPVDPARHDAPREIRARSLVVATGASQRPLPLPGWTLPGVIAAGAAQQLLNVDGVLPGARCAIVGVDLLALGVGHQLAEAGAEVVGLVLPPRGPYAPTPATPREAVAELGRIARRAPSAVVGAAGRIAGQVAGAGATALIPRVVRAWGIPLHLRQAAAAVTGTDGVTGLRVVDVDGEGRPRPDSAEQWHVDTVILSGGVAPLSEAAQLAGCPTVYVPELGGWVPLHGPDLETPVPGLFVAGSATGVEGRDVAAAQGRLAGLACAAYLAAATGEQAASLRSLARDRVAATRRSMLPFLREIEKGRARMAELWREATAAG